MNIININGGKMRKLLSIFIAIVLIFALLSPTKAANQEIKITVDGVYLESDVKPFLKNGRTMIPVRFIVEALGGNIEYDPDKYDFPMVYIRAYEEDLGIALFIDKKIALISEGTYKTDVAPIVVSNRTFLPIRFVADYLNFDVDWDMETNTVIITNRDYYIDEWTRMNKYYNEAAGERLHRWLIDDTNNIPFSYVVDDK